MSLEFSMILLWFSLACVSIATWTDLRKREVPDSLSIVLGLAAVGVTATGWSGLSWASLLGGAALGFALSVPLFAREILGGGDVKLLTALGAALGMPHILGVLFWTGIVGGFLGLVALLRKKQDLAYVPAILGGLATFMTLKAGLADAILGR